MYGTHGAHVLPTTRPHATRTTGRLQEGANAPTAKQGLCVQPGTMQHVAKYHVGRYGHCARSASDVFHVAPCCLMHATTRTHPNPPQLQVQHAQGRSPASQLLAQPVVLNGKHAPLPETALQLLCTARACTGHATGQNRGGHDLSLASHTVYARQRSYLHRLVRSSRILG